MKRILCFMRIIKNYYIVQQSAVIFVIHTEGMLENYLNNLKE